MSDTAATPATAPASVEDVIGLLIAEQEVADTDAAPEARQPTPEAQPGNPDAGDTQSQDADPDPQEQEPPRYRVKVRGQEIEVPLPELLNGYSRTEDYKAKTAEVAEARRALEAQQAEIQARAQQLDRLVQQAPLDPVLAEGQRTDWQKLAQEDPAAYVQQKAAYEARLQYWNAVEQERQRAFAERYQQQLVRANEALSENLPEWRDETRRPELQRKIGATLKAYGFTEQELNGIADHRVLQVALDAARYRDSLKAQQSVAEKKAPPQPVRTMRPGSGEKAKPNARALLQTAARGSLDDQVNAVLAALEQE